MVGLHKYLKLWLILNWIQNIRSQKFSNFTYGCCLVDGLQILQSTDDFMVAGTCLCLSRLVVRPQELNIMTPNMSSEYKQNISRKSEKLWRALQRWYFLHIGLTQV